MRVVEKIMPVVTYTAVPFKFKFRLGPQQTGVEQQPRFASDPFGSHTTKTVLCGPPAYCQQRSVPAVDPTSLQAAR
jgi:hypothetical protein